MAFCLLPQYANVFLTNLRNGTFDPVKLQTMSSMDRRNLFAQHLGEENAAHVNAAFEKTLLLKHQQKALVNWATQMAGLKPEVKRDILAKVGRMDDVLTPTTQYGFLNDLANQRLGFGVTEAEAAELTRLAKDVEQARSAVPAGQDNPALGKARAAFANYVSDLKNDVKKPVTVVGTVEKVAGSAKSLKATLDNSALFRQGWKMLFAHPTVWAKNAGRSWVDIARSLGGKEVMDDVNARIYGSANYDLYTKAKLAIGNAEEQFPSAWPEKIPALGRVFKASEAAFTAFQYRSRVDAFDLLLKVAERQGRSVRDPKLLESMGKMINSLTGRGDLGRFETSADLFNAAFFSPRKLKSDLDFLTAHQFQKDVDPFVRKQAIKNLVQTAAGTAAILWVAHMLNPDSVEIDPRSADFGKIKVGKTRFDMTAGMASLITFMSRIVTRSTKSSTTGAITKLNEGGFGKRTLKDVAGDFTENKLSPLASVMNDFLKGETHDHERPGFLNELNNLLTPLPITNALELKREGTPESLFFTALVADGLGISTNTYGKNPYVPPTSTTDRRKGVDVEVPEVDRARMKADVTAELERRRTKLAEEPTFQRLPKAAQDVILKRMERSVRSGANRRERHTLTTTP